MQKVMEERRINFSLRPQIDIGGGDDALVSRQAGPQARLVVLEVRTADDDVTGSDNLIGLKAFRHQTRSIVLNFTNAPTIAEGKHRTSLHASGLFLVFADTPATRLYIPVGGHVTDPFRATVLVAVIGRPIE